MKSLLRELWRRLPAAPRRAAFRAMTAAFAPPLPQAGAHALDGAAPRIVVGFLTSPSGLGQAARLAITALAAEGKDAYGIDLGAFFYERSGVVPFAYRDGRAVAGAAHVIININAPLLRYTYQLLGRRFLRDKYVTGYWAWELPRAPDDWREGLERVHAVATPSRFVAQAIEALGWNGPMTVAPHPVGCEALPAYAPRTAPVTDAAPFTVAFGFNAASGFERKNPVALVKAFRTAFPHGGTAARLRLLASNLDQYDAGARQLAAAIGDDPRIEITRASLDRDGYWRWLGDPDLYASLHRSEGFGLGMAEAMCRGVPVLATNWSANAEYMDEASAYLVRYAETPVIDPQEKYAAGQSWAEADVAHAAELMRRAAEDGEERRRIAAAGQRAALQRFSSFPL